MIQGVILNLPPQWRKALDEMQKSLSLEDQEAEKARKLLTEAKMVKALKHAHHHHMDVTFAELFQETQQENFKQHRVTERYLK